MATSKIGSLPEVEAAWNYSLFDALFNRRSRRFGLGMEIKEGYNKFKSEKEPVPLSEIEEAMLVAAGTGISGLNLSDATHYPLEEGAMNTMLQLTGRTWPSACGSHGTELFYTNDEGVYMVKLKDVRPEKIREYETLDDRDKMLQVFRENRIQLQEGRLDVPRVSPIIFSFNLYNTNMPGTTLFMPITDITWEYINLLLLLCDEPYRMNFVDERKGGRNAGTDKMVKDGWLKADLANPIGSHESGMVAALAGAEGAFIAQNLMLALQAMGLGGWVFGGFTSMVAMGGTPLCKGLGFRFVTGSGELPTPAAVGIDGIFESYCPPYYDSMDDAVDAVVAAKWGEQGIYTKGGGEAPFLDRECFEQGVPRASEEAIESVKAVCSYIYDTYGKFPGNTGAMHMIYWIQAHHLELDFYDKYYKSGAYTETQKNHMKLWHSGEK